MNISTIAHQRLFLFLLAVTLGLLAVQADDRQAFFSLELSDPVAPAQPPRSYRVVQSLDERGFPAGYALSFTTHVCVDEQCRMVKVTMHWNALGYYQRLECPPDTPLTKKKHVPFEAQDYARLDQVLKDRESILGQQPLDTFVKPVPEIQAVDGLSGATPQTVKDAVVDGAAYTSWTMWRWANGEIVPQLQGLTARRCTPAYLRHLLRSADRRDVDFALKYVSQHQAADPQFADDVFHVLQTGDREHVAMALKFLDRAVPDRRQLHARLIEAYTRVGSNYGPLIIDYFTAQAELPAETLEGLTGVLDRLPYFQLHLILRLLDQRAFFSPQVEANVRRLLDNKDFFIARRASEYLSKQTLSDPTKRDLQAFREKHRDRL